MASLPWNGPSEPQRPTLKDQLASIWRPRILARDRHVCCACGGQGMMNVAHVTSVKVFIEAFGPARGLRWSFRWDNLVTLCRPCHAAQHGEEQVHPADAAQRKEFVHNLFEKVRRERGWVAPQDAMGRPDSPSAA